MRALTIVLPRSSLALVSLGLICLSFAAGKIQWDRRDRGRVAVLVDTSQSTRTATFREARHVAVACDGAPDMIDGWLGLLGELEAVLEGKKTFLKSFGMDKDGKGLNLKTLFEDPPEKFIRHVSQ